MDHAGVKAALARVMSRNNCFPALLEESDDKITVDTIMEKVEAKAECIGVAPAVVAKDLLLSRLKTLAQDVVEGHSRSRELELLADTMEHLVERKVLAGTELEESLLLEPLLLSLPLTSIWRMSRAKVISLEQVIKRIYETNNEKKASLVKELLDLLLYRKGSSNTKAASDILALLVDLMYSGSLSQEWQPLAKYAGEVLKSLTEGVLDAILDTSQTHHSSHKPEIDKKSSQQPVEEHQTHRHKKQKQEDEEELSDDSSDVPNMYQLVLENPRVPHEAIEAFFSAQLVQVLTHRPNIKLKRVLKEQKAWCSAKANPALMALLQKLLVGLGHGEALNVLELVLSNEEVNWGCVLTLVATALTCHHSTAARLKVLIERNIRRGCEDLESESMVVGFLLARHAGQEGRHVFPPYPQWFSSLFTSESTSPAAPKQSFVFLMRFLTDMVPHEPAYCVRAHLNAHIFTPKGCQEILQSYNHLARVRLQELKDAQEDGRAPLPRTMVADEVEAAVKQFSETGKVPSSILKDSIFREKYFKTSFLPALLAPRHLPEVPDARAKLIEALHNQGKISQTMLRNYTEACQKESSNLLQGVFMDTDEEEEVVIEEPITELQNLLEVLVSTHYNHSTGDSKVTASELLPVLSKVSLKIEEMMKGFDAQFKDANHVAFDQCLYDEKLLSSQIVDHIINTLAILLCPPSAEESESPPAWLSQLLSLLSTSVTLQRSLLLQLVHHLSQENVTQKQLSTDGFILCELTKIEGLFLPVVEATSPSKTPLPFTSHYLNSISLESPVALHNACSILSSWLQWYILCEGPAATPPKVPLMLYLCIAPRIPLMLNHKGDRIVTTADVYSYMEGNDVPECSRLYFSDSLKGQTCKIPFKTWVKFEARAGWGEVPVEVRQTYLLSRLQKNISLAKDFNPSTPEPLPPFEKVVASLVLSFAISGLKQNNASDMLLLLQSASLQCKNVGCCLLEAWHVSYKEGWIDSRATLTFINICRSLSSSLFLRVDVLLELAEIMQTLVNVLMSVIDTIQLSLCDTTFLCSAVFAVADEPRVNNIHVDLCLNSIRPAVVFHWSSLRSFFRSHTSTINKQEQFKILCIALCQVNSNLQTLGAEEAGIRLLSLTLSQTTTSTNITNISVKTSYLKWALAYLGLRQLKGYIPLIYVEGNDLNISELDETVVLASYKELKEVLERKAASEVTNDMFPKEEETHLGLSLVPVACVFILLCVKEGRFTPDGEAYLCDADFFEILLQCSNSICQAFDSQNDDSDQQPDKSRKIYPRNKKWLPDLDYLSQLHLKLISHLSSASPSALARISKTTLLKCDSEVRATIYSKVASQGT